jgi:hypothetical protein
MYVVGEVVDDKCYVHVVGEVVGDKCYVHVVGEVIGDKYMYLVCYVYVVALKRSDCINIS